MRSVTARWLPCHLFWLSSASLFACFQARELQRLHASLLESTVLQPAAAAAAAHAGMHPSKHWLTGDDPSPQRCGRGSTVGPTGSGSGSGSGRVIGRGGVGGRSVQEQQQQWEEELHFELEARKRGGTWQKPGGQTHAVE